MSVGIPFFHKVIKYEEQMFCLDGFVITLNVYLFILSMIITANSLLLIVLIIIIFFFKVKIMAMSF